MNRQDAKSAKIAKEKTN